MAAFRGAVNVGQPLSEKIQERDYKALTKFHKYPQITIVKIIKKSKTLFSKTVELTFLHL